MFVRFELRRISEGIQAISDLRGRGGNKDWQRKDRGKQERTKCSTWFYKKKKKREIRVLQVKRKTFNQK